MLNNYVVVGRLVNDPTIEELEGKKKGTITLAVQRAFKNEDGLYDTDFIDCVLWNGILESTTEYCKKGDVIGVRGRIQTRFIETEDGTKNKVMEVMADKITFLSSKKVEDK